MRADAHVREARTVCEPVSVAPEVGAKVVVSSTEMAARLRSARACFVRVHESLIVPAAFTRMLAEHARTVFARPARAAVTTTPDCVTVPALGAP